MAWFPLESNPDVMNKYLLKLGVSEKWITVDVYGLEPDLLALISKPVLSVILLYPRTEYSLNYDSQESKDIKENGQVVSPDLFFLKQVVSNASGTVALIHSIANNLDQIELTDGKFKELLEFCKRLSPEDRGELLESTYSQIMLVHQELALEGQTELKRNETVINNFIAFVHKDGYLYELNGRKEFPINHGPSSQETLLEDAARVCKKFMERELDDINFAVLALVAAEI